MQEKLRRALKMLEEYGYSLAEACREAKVDKQTVKKWKAKLQRKEAERAYKLPKQEMNPRKAARLRTVKEFIDDNEGNVFLKDVKFHLQENGKGKVSEQTLSYWIRKNLGYSYKKAVTMSPDLKKVEFVQHQAYVAEKLQAAIKYGLYLIYVDETAFTRNEGKSYGYAPRGARLSFSTHKPTYSIGGIAAMSKFRLEGF
jgi:transposase